MRDRAIVIGAGGQLKRTANERAETIASAERRVHKLEKELDDARTWERMFAEKLGNINARLDSVEKAAARLAREKGDVVRMYAELVRRSQDSGVLEEGEVVVVPESPTWGPCRVQLPRGHRTYAPY